MAGIQCSPTTLTPNFINSGDNVTSTLSVTLNLGFQDVCEVDGYLIRPFTRDTVEQIQFLCSLAEPTAPPREDANWVDVPNVETYTEDVPFTFSAADAGSHLGACIIIANANDDVWTALDTILFSP